MNEILAGSEKTSLNQDSTFVSASDILLADEGAVEQRKDARNKAGLALLLASGAIIYFLFEGGSVASEEGQKSIFYLVMAAVVIMGAMILALQAAFGLRETTIRFDGVKHAVVKKVRKGFKSTEDVLQGEHIAGLTYEKAPVPLGPGVQAFDIRLNVVDGQPWFLKRVFSKEQAEDLIGLIEEWRETFTGAPIDN